MGLHSMPVGHICPSEHSSAQWEGTRAQPMEPPGITVHDSSPMQVPSPGSQGVLLLLGLNTQAAAAFPDDGGGQAPPMHSGAQNS